ncbi:hypothetical protein AMS58_05735 [Pseudoalteromonas porphyrae]|uniref:Uncharacterized protein n=1 Tax=Pseudoalteromonas porphyrae TaxID=187330 RepID=A0A0N1MW74_9GAMM|nr:MULTISPECIES: hypothetical protein [Pseudoalteromonas]KPH65477.1 hypothetical protein ADS77_00650 [Pseudoalteromonas porphyrae]KPH95689.1 hypothetical protein AMS58_05735 [Pseudoalteromonas porphyrae]NNG41762.1 hypothetical protein [Pseudoalteromonas sp. NEC-BIFX-2020_002]
MTSLLVLTLTATQLCYNADADTHAIKIERFISEPAALLSARKKREDMCIDINELHIDEVKKLVAADGKTFSLEKNK